MPNYQQGKIYTIRCRTDDTMIYVGSTTQPLCERLAGHKRDSKKQLIKNSLIYKTVNDDWNNWYIELHSLCPCNSKDELCRKEGEIIREIATLNVRIEGRTPKEYRLDNKEILAARQNKYNKNNKEERAGYNKEYYNDNKEKLTNRNKEWFQKNKEKRAAYNKKRYEAKKAEKLNSTHIT